MPEGPTVIRVDIVECGRARVLLPNGYAYVARERPYYSATVDEWDDGPEEGSLPHREGFTSYKAAAVWLARTLGHSGKLDIRTERDYR